VGRLPCARDSAVLTVDPGDEVTIDTVSHEGILEDRGATRWRSSPGTASMPGRCWTTRSRWRVPSRAIRLSTARTW